MLMVLFVSRPLCNAMQFIMRVRPFLSEINVLCVVLIV